MQLGQKHASRVLTKKSRGPVQTIFAKVAEAALLSPHLVPTYKLCWSPLTWWPQQASIGSGPRVLDLALEAGEHTTGQETTQMWTMATGPMDILCQGQV